MQVTLVPSSVDGRGSKLQFLSSYLLNDTVAIDAGCLGFHRTPKEQAQIKHLFITHTHLDHVASLPMFLSNTYTGDGDCVTLYGSEVVLECLRRDLFNDRLWPDFVRLSAEGPPFLKLRTLLPGRPVECDGLRLTPEAVDHLAPTLGFLVEDAGAAIVVTSDTGPTQAIWDLANRAADLKAVFLEASFPNAMSQLAHAARHLTPALFAREVRKVTRPVRFIAVHISPAGRGQIVKELKALGIPGLEIGRFGRPYSF